MQEKLIQRSARALFAAAWVSVVAPAHAISLGDLEVRSALGDVLDARVPLVLEPGEVVDATCFALTPAPEPGVPVLTAGRLTVERVGGQSMLRIRSSKGVFEPALRLRVRAACPGPSGVVLREYSLLLEPRRNDAVKVNVPAISAVNTPVAAANSAGSATTAVAATLAARPGDTLHGLATKVFPGNDSARDLYLKAMRDANPALASLADDEPIPAGADVALPDLRTFATTAPSRAILAGALPEPKPRAAQEERRARQEPRPRAIEKAEAAADAPASVASPRPSSGGFVLKLSGNDLDVSRSRGVDDRVRAQLRERLMVLESDDQVAAMLALRSRLSQLEARVNELQLKLAQMPSSFPSRPATEAPAPASPVAAPPPAVPAAAARSDMPPPEAAPQPEAAPSPAETRDASASVAVAPKVETTKPESGTGAAEASSSKPPAENPAPAKAVANGATPAPSFDMSRLWRSYGSWAAFIAVLALLMLLAWRLTHRGEAEYETSEWDEAPPPEEVAVESADDEGAAQDATQALQAPDAGALRRRYIEERFPEVANGALALDDPASVVKGARLLYEDGAVPRAIELLQFAIEENPMGVRPWLALFEIFRLERLTGEFAELARRFYEQHGNTEYWRKIRYFGREIDPGNFLYREDVDALETIPPGARANAGDRFDAARENWLGTPMDFDNEVLANELRQALMANAGVVDQDLVPNPMPALRDAEMFTVA